MGRREWYRSISKGEREVLGCMSGMLHLFDFHHILLTTKTGRSRASAHNSLPQLHHCHSQLKVDEVDSHAPNNSGVEAPRNSLELDEAAAAKTASTASALAEEYYGIPIGIQIKSTVPTLTKKKMKKDLQLLLEEEEKNSSQCETPRTHNVIARLMGLEILPNGASTTTKLFNGFKSQDHSPKINGTNKKMSNRKPLQKLDTNLMGSRSLPDTPRASSERVRDSDPRLSLQINKENNKNNNNNIYNNRATHLCDVSHSLPPSPRRKDCYNKIQDENNKSPRSHYYTREIVKQVKENINRRGTSNEADENAMTRSRRTRVPTDKRVLLVENNDFAEFSKIRAPPKPPRPQSTVQFNVGENVVEKQKKCKKASCERFTERIKRQPPTSEIATQSHVMLPNPISSACSNLKALPQNNRCSSEKIKSRYNVIATSTTRRKASYRSPSPPLERTCAASIVNPTQEQQLVQYRRVKKDQDPEFLYVRSLLERAGIMNSPTQELRWYSPSLPIDPFIFHQLELDLPLFRPQKLLNDNLSLLSPLRHRCNRKLLFHLVEEVLGDLLTWSTSTKSQKRRLHDINKELLLERLWSQIKSFPLANCQTIEDIDALVAGDMSEVKVRHLLRHPLVVAEAEDIVFEIEEDVVDSIVAEAAASLAICSKL